MQNVASRIKTIRDIMRKDSGVDGDAQRLSQLVWLLFLKIYSDKEISWKKSDRNFKNPIPPKLRWDTWTQNSNKISDDEIISFINTELFPTLKNLDGSKNPQAKVVRSVFEDTYNYMKNGSLFRQVIEEINKIDFLNTNDDHVFNEIYENILKELQSAGSSGEYYTPRAVTQFMVEMVNPSITDIILDPACGTGGFLTSSIKHLLSKTESKKTFSRLRMNIRGIEKKPLPHLLCITNLMLNGIDTPAVSRDNLLSKPLSKWTNKDYVSVILSNPPFGGLEESGTENNFPIEFRTKETADLFVVLIVNLLKKNGGKASVILPDGFLFGTGVRTRIKEELLKQCNLHTIVRLPNGVFSPYTNIKTNILFFDKGRPTEEIWYFEHLHPLGQKNYNRSKPISLKEFDVEKQWWANRKETDYAWKVSMKDIRKRNFNLDISSPYYGEDEEQLSSIEVIRRLQKSMKKSQEILSTFQTDFE